MTTRSVNSVRAAVAALALYALLPMSAHAQPAVAGATPLQQAAFNAVFNMCTKDLDTPAPVDQVPPPPPPLTPAQNDLHDQCHAIAVSTLTNSGSAQAAALGALQQVSGNELAAQGALVARVTAGQFGNITGRLDALRLGTNFAGVPGGITAFQPQPQPQPGWPGGGSTQGGFLPVMSFAPVATLAASDYAAGDTGGSAGAVGTRSAASNPWGVFIQGSYQSGRHDLTANEDPFDFHASSVTAGIDYNFGSAVLGASVGYDDYDAGFRAAGTLVSGGSARVTGTSGSLYGAWFGDHLTFNGIATIGRLTTNLTRLVQYSVQYNGITDPDPQGDIADNCPGGICTVSVNRVFSGSPSGMTIAAGATAGYQQQVAGFDVMPSLSGSYRHSQIDSFAETTAPTGPGYGLGLSFGDQVIESFRSIVGLDISRALSAPFGIVTPLVRVEWDHEFRSDIRNIAAHYSNDPTATTRCDSCFLLQTDPPLENYEVAGAGVTITLAHRVQAFVYDEFVFGASHYSINSVAIGVRGQF